MTQKEFDERLAACKTDEDFSALRNELDKMLKGYVSELMMRADICFVRSKREEGLESLKKACEIEFENDLYPVKAFPKLLEELRKDEYDGEIYVLANKNCLAAALWGKGTELESAKKIRENIKKILKY